MKNKSLYVFLVSVLLVSVFFVLVFFGDVGFRKLGKYSLSFALLVGIFGGVMALLASIFSSRKAASQMLVNLNALFVTSVLALVLGEYGLRYLYSDVTTTGDSKSYFEKKWQKTVRVNSYGFRERNFQIEKPANVIRIAVIGDSLTFGKGIEEEERLSNLLEQRLNKENRTKKIRYQVLNFGRPGANTRDEIEMLEKFVLPANPDFILLQWYKNDVIDARVKAALKSGGQGTWLSRETDRAYTRVKDHSILFSLLDQQLKRLTKIVLEKPKSGKALTNFDDESMWTLFGDRGSSDSVRARDALREFIGTLKAKNIPIGMVLFTDSYFRPLSQLDYLLERVLDECSRENLTCVDMREPLAPYKGDKKLWASQLDPHPSAFANRITADEVFSAFGSSWLREN